MPGKKVYERVGVRVHADQSQAEGLVVMPPGKPLSAADTAAVDAWVAAGAPGGEDPTCAPSGGVAPPTGNPAETEWPLKECDAVYKIVAHGAGGVDTPAMAPAGRESHPQIAWDAPWGDEQVQAIAFKTITDNRAVLHHWILNGRPGGFLTGWAPGEDGIKKMRDDIGMLMPTGKGSLNLDMHYFNTTGTTDQPDNSGVEVCVVKKEHFRPNVSAVTMSLASVLFSIPPNSKYEAKASCTVSGTEPVTLLSASPHAHKLAVRMTFSVKKKDGQTIMMHDMPFAFGEQKSYTLDPPVVVTKGDVITTSCFYENTTSRRVGFGESTTDEMCFNFASYYPAGALKCGTGVSF
jgi:Copper type II ascorbate-dependent monooxygenase, C-terminal domain